MNKIFVVLLLLLLSVTSVYAQDMTIRVMSYNILYGAYPREEPYDWDRADAIISAINSYDPDVLLLQECNQWADTGNTRLTYFALQTGMSYKALSTNHGSFKLAILSKYPITSYTFFDSSVYYWWNVLTANIQLAPSFTLPIASTHFGWWGATDYYSMSEEEQAASYVAQKAVLIDYLQNRVDGDLIIGGDWNHSASSMPFGESNLHDDIAALGYGLDALRRFYPSLNPIDNIYVSRSGKFDIQNCFKASVAANLSDHTPTVADIAITFNPPPVITQNPESVSVALGDTAVLDVAGLNITAYAWHKSSDNSNSTPGDDVQVGGAAVLSVDNFKHSDEGYYYCIVSNSYGSTYSDVVSATVAYDIEPRESLVESGGSVAFTVSYLADSDYAWYKSQDNSTETTADDVAVGGNSHILNLTNVQMTNEGYYYCVISRNNLNTVSKMGFLMTKRLVAQWGFNSSLNEYISGYKAVSDVTAVYDTGIEGSGAVIFSGDGDDYLRVVYRKKLNLSGFTFVFWAQTAAGTSGTSRVLINSRNTLAEDSSGVLAYIRGNDNWAYVLRTGDGSSSLIEGSQVPEGQWQFVALTFELNEWDSENAVGTASLYVDGLLVGSMSNVSYRPNSASSAVDMVLGSGWTVENGYFNPFNGLLDDLRYYSYALSGREVAQIYADATGQEICMGELEIDFDNDCDVDINDLEMLLTEWLINGNVSSSR